MKKIFPVLGAVLLAVLTLAGCTPANTQPEGDVLSIVTTNFPPYDFARQIAGDRAQITMLLPPGTESHSYDPTPQDIKKIQNCDVFLYTGGPSDQWVEDILSSFDTSGIQILPLVSCVQTLEEEHVEGMEVEEEEEENQHEIDTHVWTSPVNAMAIVERIEDAIETADPENAQFYQEAEEEYLAQLEELDAQFREIVENGVRKTIVMGDRFPFRYLVEEYGLDYYAAFPGCASQTEPSAATLAFLIDKTKEEEIPVVFHMELSNEKVADVICESTGAEKRLLHSCHNVTKDDFDSGVTYLTLMEQNAQNLKEALS